MLEHWPVQAGAADADFTTIGNWRGYGSVEHDGVHYGQKAHSMRELHGASPTRTDAPFRLALDIHPGETPDLEALDRNGWQLVDPATVAADPDAYRAFIAGSLAELGIAKSGYVLSRCGWFSDRSACYLASGRPVVAQDTGFGAFLPTGEGLLSFADRGRRASPAIEDIRADYDRHARAARGIAEEHLDSRPCARARFARPGAEDQRERGADAELRAALEARAGRRTAARRCRHGAWSAARATTARASRSRSWT